RRERAADFTTQLPEEKIGLGKALLQKTKAADHARPTPALMRNFEHIDLKHVAWSRALHENRSRERVDAGAIDGEKLGGSHRGMHLHTTGVDTFHVHGVAGCDAQTRWQCAVPKRMW